MRYLLKRTNGKKFESLLETDEPGTLYRHKAIYDQIYRDEFDREHPEQLKPIIFDIEQRLVIK